MGKRKKHPDAPKSAMGAYMWFCQEKRDQVKEEMPELGAKEILSELGRRWKQLTDADKVQYNDLAKEDRERFDKEKEIFLKTHVSLYMEDDSKGSSKRKKKDPNAPKRPRSAYILFVNAYRPKVVEETKGEGIKQTEIMSRVAKLWKSAAVDEKEKFYELAKEEKEKYAVAIANYQNSLSAGGMNQVHSDSD